MASRPTSRFVMDGLVVTNSDLPFSRQKRTGLIFCVPVREREILRLATEAIRGNIGSYHWEALCGFLRYRWRDEDWNSSRQQELDMNELRSCLQI